MQLGAELRTDGSAGAGDQHRLTGQVAGDQVDVGLHGPASQEVFLRDGPDVLDSQCPVQPRRWR